MRLLNYSIDKDWVNLFSDFEIGNEEESSNEMFTNWCYHAKSIREKRADNAHCRDLEVNNFWSNLTYLLLTQYITQ